MDVATLAADYEETLEALSERPLPSYRVAELRARVETVLRLLSEQRVVPAAPLQRLLCAVTEAMADVQDATLVADGDRDAGCDAGSRLTPAERRTTLDTLVRLLFTVVETPTPGDERGVDHRRHRHRRRTSDPRTSTATDADADADANATDADDADADTNATDADDADADANATDADDADADADDTEIGIPIETTYAGPE